MFFIDYQASQAPLSCKQVRREPLYTNHHYQRRAEVHTVTSDCSTAATCCAIDSPNTHWKDEGQEKVSPVDHSGPPGLFCRPAGNFGHSTSITSLKATLSVFADTRVNQLKGF